MGNIHAPSHLMTLTDDRLHRIAEGPVAIVAESVGLAMTIKRTLEERGILTAPLVTSGNEAGLTTADYIAYYATLPFVRVVVCYLEAVRDPGHLRAACTVAHRAGKPVTVSTTMPARCASNCPMSASCRRSTRRCARCGRLRPTRNALGRRLEASLSRPAKTC